MTAKMNIGLIGLGTMGRGLAHNLSGHEHKVMAYEPQAKKAENPTGQFTVCKNLQELAESLSPPRTIVVLVKAGEPVDQMIGGLSPHLEAGDMVIDGGNSHYLDTDRRAGCLAEKGVHFFGVGISGGREGARTGASIMAGGDEAAYHRIEPLLNDLAAPAEGGSCLAYIGPGGAGHFVKMAHNAIEYAMMQIISETCLLGGRLGGLDHQRMADVFAKWNRGAAGSYLVSITARILEKTDPETGAPLLEVISGTAGQKGTGRWAVAAAMELGVPVPTIAEAVAARDISAIVDEPSDGRRPPQDVNLDTLISDLEEAMTGAFISAFDQGLALIAGGKRRHGWPVGMAEICRVWRRGCIIRAKLVERIGAAYEAEAELSNLLSDPGLAETLDNVQEGWRRTVAAAARAAIPVPALGSALAYFDALAGRAEGAALIQGMRDFFGGHGLERAGQGGRLEVDWTEKQERS